MLLSIHKTHRFRSSCTCTKCADSDHPVHAQSVPLLFIDTFCSNHWFCWQTAKAQIRLRICPVWSGSSLFAYTQRHIFTWHNPNAIYRCKQIRQMSRALSPHWSHLFSNLEFRLGELYVPGFSSGPTMKMVCCCITRWMINQKSK